MWATKAQFTRYKEYDKLLPVFIAIGVGGYGKASSPDFLYLIPVRDIKYIGLFETFLRKYELYNPESKNVDDALSYKKLWKLI